MKSKKIVSDFLKNKSGERKRDERKKGGKEKYSRNHLPPFFLSSL
jgi:hypothetical protein